MRRVIRKLRRIFRHCVAYWLRERKIRFFLSFLSYIRVSELPKKQGSSARIFQRSIYFPDGFWFLHSIREIFIDQIYKFRAERENPYIIDCGSNIGLSVIYFKMLYPKSRIVAFEPDASIFHILERNIAQFHFQNIDLVNKGVWNDDTVLSFHSEGALGGKVILESSGDFLPELVSVQTARLRHYLETDVDFLKVDIEGAEHEVLLDCKDVLRNVKFLFIEYHSTTGAPQQLNEILDIVSEAGFRYYIKQAWDIVRYPFVDKKGRVFDLQLNIFCYR